MVDNKSRRQHVLNEFIGLVFEQNQTRKRSDRNNINKLVSVTNKVFKKHTSLQLEYSDKELLDAFYELGYLILDPIGNTSIFNVNKPAPSGHHVNVKSQCVSDLITTLRDPIPKDSSEGTIDRINELKNQLKELGTHIENYK